MKNFLLIFILAITGCSIKYTDCVWMERHPISHNLKPICDSLSTHTLKVTVKNVTLDGTNYAVKNYFESDAITIYNLENNHKLVIGESAAGKETALFYFGNYILRIR